MATLTGTLFLTRASIVEVVSNPNTVPRYVVSGTAGAVGGSSSGKVNDLTVDGTFRQYGNGNTRLILGSAITETQTFALRALTPDQVAIVRALLGHTVCYRDTYGRRFFGAFTDLKITDIPLSGDVQSNTLLTDIGIVLSNVTYNEVV